MHFVRIMFISTSLSEVFIVHFSQQAKKALAELRLNIGSSLRPTLPREQEKSIQRPNLRKHIAVTCGGRESYPRRG